MDSTLLQEPKSRRVRESRFSKQPGNDLSSSPQSQIESRWSEGGKTISIGQTKLGQPEIFRSWRQKNPTKLWTGSDDIPQQLTRSIDLIDGRYSGDKHWSRFVSLSQKVMRIVVRRVRGRRAMPLLLLLLACSSPVKPAGIPSANVVSASIPRSSSTNSSREGKGIDKLLKLRQPESSRLLIVGRFPKQPGNDLSSSWQLWIESRWSEGGKTISIGQTKLGQPWIFRSWRQKNPTKLWTGSDDIPEQSANSIDLIDGIYSGDKH